MKPVSIFDDLTLDHEIKNDVTEKMVDVYNYMAANKLGKIVLQFETGIKMVCEIDSTEWKNPPRIDLNEVLKGE